MKRSGPPERRTPLGRGKPPTRRQEAESGEGRPPIKRGKPPQRRGRIRQTSAKRDAERPERARVREEALRKAGHRCQGSAVVPEVECRGPLDVDELAGRGRYPGGHLDPNNVHVLCRGHHEWKHANPADARERGLDRPAPPPNKSVVRG